MRLAYQLKRFSRYYSPLLVNLHTPLNVNAIKSGLKSELGFLQLTPGGKIGKR